MSPLYDKCIDEYHKAFEQVGIEYKVYEVPYSNTSPQKGVSRAAKESISRITDSLAGDDPFLHILRITKFYILLYHGCLL